MIQASRWDIVVVGGAYTDYMVRGSTLPTPGETVVGNEFLEVPGSKGSNQAVEAARLGARVAMVARVGADRRGDEIIESLKDEGVETRYMVRDSSAKTGISLIQINEQGKPQMMVALGANSSTTIEDVQQAAEAIKASKVLLTQLEVPLEVAMAAVRIGHEAGAQVIFDPAPVGGGHLPDGLLQMVDVIKPDTKEAQAITGIHVHDRASARQAAQQLFKRGVKAASVQAGSQGDLLVWHDGELWLPRIPVKSIDATGAGDTFAAALAVALAEGRSFTDAGPFASAAAALATTRLGARPALPRRNEVMDLLSHAHSHT
jgi:ribokinase